MLVLRVRHGGQRPLVSWIRCDGRQLNGLNGAKRLNGWNDWNGIDSEQGIFVSIVISTKAKSKPTKS